ncbi:hypothetical protein [Methylosinus sp. Sm6]|uniref:hypothetical protein n=1 Tax=Methylosinus sp. Sm6 TaxID=2866948 RepID=UPI001C99D4EE|nr:hypothetical protein [Methylosinus sp. Sm6]MBY6243737.1 hypothetical protein [Methylosinus sp. Sm6]
MMMYEVKLKRRVEVEGHVYMPNLTGRIRHVVDQATLDALSAADAEAVVEARPIAEGGA